MPTSADRSTFDVSSSRVKVNCASEILARAVVAFERLHVEPTYDGSPFEQVVKCEKPGAVAGFVVTADEWERQLAGSRSPSSAVSVMPSSAAYSLARSIVQRRASQSSSLKDS